MTRHFLPDNATHQDLRVLSGQGTGAVEQSRSGDRAATDYLGRFAAVVPVHASLVP